MIITNPGPSHTCGVELAEKLLHHLAFTIESIAVRSGMWAYDGGSPSARKEPPLMNESVRTTVKCEDPGDGTGDFIIDLPDGILEHMGLNIGDFLTIELIGGNIVLKPIRDADPQP